MDKVTTTCLKKQRKWDIRFLQQAKLVSTWSKDPSTKVGAVIADPYNRFISLGFNGYPRLVEDDSSLDVREIKYEKVVHSEVNAILFARGSVEGFTLYVYGLFPCSRCMGPIIQSGIVRIVAALNPNKETSDKWDINRQIALDMANQANITIEIIPAKEIE